MVKLIKQKKQQYIKFIYLDDDDDSSGSSSSSNSSSNEEEKSNDFIEPEAPKPVNASLSNKFSHHE
jgi:hypothetical protein